MDGFPRLCLPPDVPTVEAENPTFQKFTVFVQRGLVRPAGNPALLLVKSFSGRVTRLLIRSCITSVATSNSVSKQMVYLSRVSAYVQQCRECFSCKSSHCGSYRGLYVAKKF